VATTPFTGGAGRSAAGGGGPRAASTSWRARSMLPEARCNNPKFWKIEINGFIKIPNFGDNKNFDFKYKINFLSFKTCEFEHLLPCFK
jgi:hypothetical protein